MHEENTNTKDAYKKYAKINKKLLQLDGEILNKIDLFFCDIFNEHENLDDTLSEIVAIFEEFRVKISHIKQNIKETSEKYNQYQQTIYPSLNCGLYEIENGGKLTNPITQQNNLKEELLVFYRSYSILWKEMSLVIKEIAQFLHILNCKFLILDSICSAKQLKNKIELFININEQVSCSEPIYNDECIKSCIDQDIDLRKYEIQKNIIKNLSYLHSSIAEAEESINKLIKIYSKKQISRKDNFSRNHDLMELNYFIRIFHIKNSKEKIVELLQKYKIQLDTKDENELEVMVEMIQNKIEEELNWIYSEGQLP